MPTVPIARHTHRGLVQRPAPSYHCHICSAWLHGLSANVAYCTACLPQSVSVCTYLLTEHDHESVLRNCKAILSTGLMQKAEAWVRKAPPSAELAGLLSHTLDCAARTAVHHLATSHAASVYTVYLSLAATVRKLSYTERLFASAGHSLDCNAACFSYNEATLVSAIDMLYNPLSASSGNQLLCRATAHHALLQLLPAYISLLQDTSVRACQQQWPGIRNLALHMIAPMHALGMDGLSAYAGMPELLLGLLRAFRSLASDNAFAAAASCTAADDNGFPPVLVQTGQCTAG